MTELRRGRIRDRWVVVAPDREARPFGPTAPSDQLGTGDCPFCPGREERTPPEIDRIAGPDGEWCVRVVSNKYPALSPCDRGSASSDGAGGVPPFDGSGAVRASACGAHEVVIETPDHGRRLADLDVDQVRRVLDVFSARMRALAEDPAHRHLIVYKNYGAEAGASLPHAHSQIVAAPIVPTEVGRIVAAAEAFHVRTGRCLFCDVLREELADGRRVVEASDAFVVFAPFDARVPYELAIYPRDHEADFADLDGEGRRALAGTLKRTLRRLTTVLGDVPYNLVLQSAPNDRALEARRSVAAAYHWRIEIIPRRARLGGLEWGAGLLINGVSPETAAERLRAEAPGG